MEDMNNTQSAIEAGLALAQVRYVEGRPFVALPNTASIKDMEHMLPVPTRMRGTITLRDKDSFVAVVNKHKGSGTTLYGSYDKPGFIAVFNDDAGGVAGWKDHRAVYDCPVSAEWATWNKADGRVMNQAEFAQFIESNLPDIAVPPAADMLEISRSLEAKKKVNFASGIRLSNGQNELTYEEEISGTAAKGKLQVPELFTIGIPVLEGGLRYAVEARLRYRIQDGGRLTIWYELIRPHKIIEDAVREVWTDIEQKTELKVLNGHV